MLSAGRTDSKTLYFWSVSYSIEVWPGSVWKFGLVAKTHFRERLVSIDVRASLFASRWRWLLGLVFENKHVFTGRRWSIYKVVVNINKCSYILTDLAWVLEVIEFTTWPVSNLVTQVALNCLLTITCDKAIGIALNHVICEITLAVMIQKVMLNLKCKDFNAALLLFLILLI